MRTPNLNQPNLDSRARVAPSMGEGQTFSCIRYVDFLAKAVEGVLLQSLKKMCFTPRINTMAPPMNT